MIKNTILIVALFFITGCSSQNFTINSANEKCFFNEICSTSLIFRVGNDYNLVNSSIEWFSGVPIFHSINLVTWKHIGYVLHRSEKLQLTEVIAPSMGTSTLTLKYNDGQFHKTTTCVESKGNFYATAVNPTGQMVGIHTINNKQFN